MLQEKREETCGGGDPMEKTRRDEGEESVHLQRDRTEFARAAFARKAFDRAGFGWAATAGMAMALCAAMGWPALAKAGRTMKLRWSATWRRRCAMG